MSNYERTKTWVKKNRELIASVVIVTGFVGIMIIAVKVDAKYKEQQEIHLNAYINEMNEWWRSQGVCVSTPDSTLPGG